MKKHSWLAGVVSLFLLVTFNSPAFSAAENQPADIRILVDISGSMKETDPNNLRLPAVNLLVEMLPDNAQAGIWTFGRYVNMLVPPTRVDKQWRDNAKAKAKESISSLGLYTNLAGVLNNASYNIDADSGFKHSVILLTDGHIDMREPGMPASVDQQENTKLMQTILPKYVAAGAKIHTVALSDQVDKNLLQQLSAATNGLYLEAHNSNDLLPVFLKAFDRAVETEQVPLVDNRFQIDAGVKEFTALILNQDNQPSTQLIAPNGKMYLASSAKADSNVRWYKDRGYELITITNPVAGEWQAKTKQNPNNRVQILTDLKLKVSGIPATLFANQEFKMFASLLNKDEKITQAEILTNTNIRLTVTAPDGRSASKLISSVEQIPADGVYQESFSRLYEAGEYRFKITAKSPTFERQRSFTSTLLEPLKIRQEKLIEEEKWLIAIEPNENVDTQFTRIHASITAPNGKVSMRELNFNEQSGYWSVYVTETDGPGEYNLNLSGQVILQGGSKFQFTPNDMHADFPLALAAELPVETRAERAQNIRQSKAPINLDLASEFERQENERMAQEELAAAGAAEEAAKAQEKEEQPEQEESNLWLYIGIALAALVLLMVAITAVVLNKKRNAKEKPVVETDKPETEEDEPAAEESDKDFPEDLIPQDIAEEETPEDIEFGDFDDFEGEQEIEIPDGAGAAEDNDTDALESDLDDDFAIDPPEDELPEDDKP